MATEIDICNLALGHLGDNANISSIDPPEGSAQAEHAARFYPLARDTLLESHSWNFASRQVKLALLFNPVLQWTYAYALPNNCMLAESIFGARGSYSVGQYISKPFVLETDPDGKKILLTNTEDAVLRYQATVKDSTEFSALFTLALSWHLASMLAGPVIKGDQSAEVSKRCVQMMATFLNQAKESDLKSKKINLEHIVPWTAGR